MQQYKNKVSLCIDANSFTIKTVETQDEFEETLRLRHSVFYEELLKKSLDSGIDVDEFDYEADHIILVEKDSKKIVGTYRLLGPNSKKFYSETEFDIGKIRTLEHKLEIGRACVDKKFRTGSAILLLWKGVYNYALKQNVEYVFGCSSIKTLDFAKIARIYSHIKESGHATDEYETEPLPAFEIEEWSELEKADKKDIPPLVNAYLKMGISICGKPAVDRAFKCVDLLTIIKMSQVKDGFKRRFKC